MQDLETKIRDRIKILEDADARDLVIFERPGTLDDKSYAAKRHNNRIPRLEELYTLIGEDYEGEYVRFR
jgi:hypothetical protein